MGSYVYEPQEIWRDRQRMKLSVEMTHRCHRWTKGTLEIMSIIKCSDQKERDHVKT
jgi:hypothetical protein